MHACFSIFIFLVSAGWVAAAEIRPEMGAKAPPCKAEDGAILEHTTEVVTRFEAVVRETVATGTQNSNTTDFKNALNQASALNHAALEECDRIEALRDWEKCAIADVNKRYGELARLCSSARGVDVIVNGAIQSLSVPDPTK